MCGTSGFNGNSDVFGMVPEGLVLGVLFFFIEQCIFFHLTNSGVVFDIESLKHET